MEMKPIRYNEKTKIFSLSTANSMYQMQVREYNTLVHLYYGANIGQTETAYRIVGRDRGFSGNPYAAGRDRTFSMDTLPQEYSGSGNGDYRINAIEAVHEDGSNVLQLSYESYRIRKGKYVLNGMPAMSGTEEEAQTLEIVLRDQGSDLKVTLLYGVFPELDVITRAVRIENRGTKKVEIKKAMSMEMDFLQSDLDFIHFHGRHAMEMMMERQPLSHGIQSIESRRGCSSHHHNPFAILCSPHADEGTGECFGYSLVYSGNFQCAIEVDQADTTRLVMGIHPYHFSYCLGQGEVFEAPEVVMAYSEQGLGRLSHIFHDAYRAHLIRKQWVNQKRPVLINNWEVTYFDFDEEKLYQIAKTGKEMGLDLFVLDDGWFGNRESDHSGLGDWVVNENKIKGGLPELVRRINALGMKFGLWIEPEMVSEDSSLYREHPDWCMRIPGRNPERSRYQLNLDISREEVREHVLEQIFQILDGSHIEYIKWDMNRSLGNVYSAALPPERQGEVFHRYVLGLYQMLERLLDRCPDLLLETCSGGGGRFDPAMLHYSPQIWCSDNTDAVERIKIQYGTSFAYPVSAMGAHVSICPNHQTGRTAPMETRGIVASAGALGFELNLSRITEAEKETVKKILQEYREKETLLQTGDYYRLTNPFQNQEYALWQVVSKDRSETIVEGVLLKCEANPRIRLIRLRGLQPEKMYQDVDSGRCYTGGALMKAGILLPVTSGDYQPVKFRFIRIEE